jgi:hypothetical protein
LNYKKLEFFVGKPRLDRFLNAAGNSKHRAQKLYRINIRVGQAFYPLLHLFETFLRNSVNHHVSVYCNSPDWIIHEKNRFMCDPSLAPTSFSLKRSVHRAELRIIQKGGTVTAGRVIAGQTFGFWTSLFEPCHYRLIGGVVIQCFPHKPPSVNRRIILQKLNMIREFRNRLYHIKPICFADDCIDFNHAKQIRQQIYELITWMDVDLHKYVHYFDSIDANIDHANRL